MSQKCTKSPEIDGKRGEGGVLNFEWRKKHEVGANIVESHQRQNCSHWPTAREGDKIMRLE